MEKEYELSVSILVLLDVWWVHTPLRALLARVTLVSILVLLDVWWVREFLGDSLTNNTPCLDPCFTGCLVGTFLGDSLTNNTPFVSILVLLDVWWVRPYVQPEELYPKNVILSRSLFYWMFGGYLIEKESLAEMRWGCLDPCFTGCLVGTLRDRGEENEKICNGCLDPCFTGCLVGTFVITRRWPSIVQSLDPCFTGCLVGTYISSSIH